MIARLVLTITILSVEVTQAVNNNFISILESKESFFHKINSNIHNAINKIFSCLRLLKYFSKFEQNELLLKTHNDFLNIAEKNYVVYEHLRNASNTNFTIGDYRNKFLESLDEIIKEETNKHKDVRNKTLNNANNYTETKTSHESLEFLDEFVDKFSKLTIENLTNYKTNETTRKSIVKLLIKSKNYELKAWNATFLNETPSNLTRRLYRGRSTMIRNYPFLVSIHILNDFMCSGSIISKDLVITAASCLQIAYNNHQNPRSVFVRVGSDYTKSYGQLMPVAKIYFHPQYDPQTLRNNIAIIRIKRQLKLSSKKGKIRRIQYIKETSKQNDGVYVLGWGAQNPRHNNPNNLQKLTVDYLDLYSFNDCQKIYTSHYVTDKNFCAGFIEKGAGACNRDVGGPGFRDGILVGIISFGPPVCGVTNSPTVFTHIGYYTTWIDSIVHQKQALKILKPIPMTTKLQIAHSARASRSKSLSKELLHTTPFTTHRPPKVNDDYPEEVMILKEMLQEIVLTNSSIIDYILYDNNLTEKQEAADATEANNFQVYNNKANTNNLRIHAGTTDKQDTTTTTQLFNNINNFPIYDRTTENDEKNYGFVDLSTSPVYGVNVMRQKVDYNVNAYTPATYNVKDEIKMTYDDDDESSDESEDYEEHSGHEHGIAIDINDIALRNISFLDVLFNLQQYQQSHFPNIRTDDKNGMDVQFVLGSESGIDTAPGYLHKKSTKIDGVDPETEEHSSSDDVDVKQSLREDNDNKVSNNNYNDRFVDPWQSAFAKEAGRESIISKQYEDSLRGRNLPEQMKHLLRTPRAN